MKNELLRVAIRQNAIFIPKDKMVKEDAKTITNATAALVANMRKYGYTVSEDLLHALNRVVPNYILEVHNMLKEVLGVNLNWAPLVKGWDVPTGETRADHLITMIYNYFDYYGNKNEGFRLECGHLIPYDTFPIERYNGCPFCGTPFNLSGIENYGQGSKLKVLTLWTDTDAENFFEDLLKSKTALDATQADSLKTLLKNLPLPTVEIKMKETLVLVVDSLINADKGDEASLYLTNPTDILRYLWYKHTGFLQLIEPKTIINRTGANNAHLYAPLNKSGISALAKKKELKLKYTRKECRMVATWINHLPMNAKKACEIMHPKRGMWVRFIRALRLAEYAKKEDFTYLKELMDVFYKQTYSVFEGDVNRFRLRADAANTLRLLKQRPGLFARSLFANMLWFGSADTLEAFDEVIDQVPARLVFTLSMYAPLYFDPSHTRVVKPLGGTVAKFPTNQLLAMYSDEEREQMIADVQALCKNIVFKRFQSVATDSKTMYIDPMLFNIPVSIGDRSETIQDTSCALQGTRFALEGDSVRLFMQWGKGLPAQHLDMDLSCSIAYESKVEICSFSNLTATGAKHSGDIRSIPNKVGTAEYIELELNQLRKAKAKYVIFTCNAYSNGDLSLDMVVGWMNSTNKMKISEKTGVAYDPSCVQHQVRVSQSLAKGMVFGVLDVAAREIIWIEMPFGGQTIYGVNAVAVESFLTKLAAKLTIGELLTTKAEAQSLTLVDNPNEADEAYTLEWALNTAAVTKLLVD